VGQNVAVVDIGSTSVQISVATVDQSSMTLLAKEKRLARLADHLDDHGCLPTSVIDELIEILRAFVSVAKQHQTTPMITATATIRAAKNRDEVIRKIHRALGLNVRVLTGADEARLVLNGVLFGHPHLRTENILTMDVGGGSTELITCASGHATTIASVRVGALVVHQRWLGFSGASFTEVKRVRRRLRQRFGNALALSGTIPVSHLVGTGGSVQRLVRLIRGAALDSDEINGMRVSRAALEDCISQIIHAKTPEARRALPGMDSERADFVLGGALLFSVAMESLGFEDLLVSTSALRTGMLAMDLS
jgi:exopolyphosphatase/guanosine-5'-triphosphate,3'-diphosphate pyrophosphatase